ncbi:uncharacterized protein LOC116957776 isoform X3 [Petromyzon marinus]|uniref:Uncharacterized protein LOC116957776 isoform X3 n=1 Tax=Petromyzon marinus TaxID=7757 RepID=A0AAJ7XJX4_PETMA|nr:uncharacterized protein LOC116957776 isoform X3 [Petromyzon marinus]
MRTQCALPLVPFTSRTHTWTTPAMGSELMEGAQEEQDLLNREWNPALLSLRSLYRGDPFYSLCLADLMRAPQALNHAIVKEQRQLAQTLRKLDTQRLSRLRQLAEERRQFEACMRHRLAPRRPHSTPHGHGPGLLYISGGQYTKRC